MRSIWKQIQISLPLFICILVYTVDAVLTITNTVNGTGEEILINGKADSITLARRFLLPEMNVVTVRFDTFAVEEASLLPGTVCAKMTIDTLCDCYRQLGTDDFLLSHLSAPCIRSIPAELFGILRPEDIPMLSKTFISRMTSMQLSSMRREALHAMSDDQFIALIRSDLEGGDEKGHACRAFTAVDIEYFEAERPKVISALTPNCIGNLGPALAGIGKKISRVNRFTKIPLRHIIHLPDNSHGKRVIEGILGNKSSPICHGITAAVLKRIPAERYKYLGRVCWRDATTCGLNNVTFTKKQLEYLPTDVWAAVTSTFISTIQFEGMNIGKGLKPLLSTIGKEKKEACHGIHNIVNILSIEGIGNLPVECLQMVKASQIAALQDYKKLAAFPSTVIATFDKKKVAAINPSILEKIPESFIRDLSRTSIINGCSGFHSEQLNSLGKVNKLSILTPECVIQIPLDTITSLDSKTISKFSDDAFSLFNRIDFFERDKDIQNLLEAMRVPQIEAFGNPELSDLHICHGLALAISALIKSEDRSAAGRKRSSEMGPVLVENCFSALHPDSFATLKASDIPLLDDDFFKYFLNPKAIEMIKDDAFKGLSQVQVNQMDVKLCSGLSAGKISVLMEGKINVPLECLERMEDTQLIQVLKLNVKPTRMAAILNMNHMISVDLLDFTEGDWKELGKSVPEALHPCRVISAIKVPKNAWPLLDEYCVSLLPDLGNNPDAKIFLQPFQLRLLSNDQMKNLMA